MAEREGGSEGGVGLCGDVGVKRMCVKLAEESIMILAEQRRGGNVVRAVSAVL